MLFPLPFLPHALPTLMTVTETVQTEKLSTPCGSGPKPSVPRKSKRSGCDSPQVHAGERERSDPHDVVKEEEEAPRQGGRHPGGRRSAVTEQTPGLSHKGPFHLYRLHAHADLFLEVQNERKCRVSELAPAGTCLR